MATNCLIFVTAKQTASDFQMCPSKDKNEVKVYYVADDIYEIQLPQELDQLPQLGEIPEQGIIGFIIIANGEEITIITNEEAYMTWLYFA